MGCCFSAGKGTAPPVCAAQIPPPVEEESVKEVVVQSVSVSVLVPDIPIAPDTEPNLPLSLPTPEISQNKSDICSVTHSHSHSHSHSFSTATTASILEDDALSKPCRPPPPCTSRRNRPLRISREGYSPQGKVRPRLVRERPSPQPNPSQSRRNVPPRRRSRSPGLSSARRSPMKKREEAPEKVDVEVKKEEDLSVTVRDPEVSMECFIFL